MRIKTLLLIAAAICTLHAHAWNSRGHMIVAAIAYSQLPPAQKTKLTELLKSHPDYNTIWKNEYAKLGSDVDLGMFLLMRASTWPDDIRDEHNPNHKFHKGDWHFVTYKIRFPNNHDTTLPNPQTTPNVVWAIDNAKTKAFNPALAKKDRAMFLAWLTHLVGDIHQPIHCATLFNTTYPGGDVGGNKIWVKQGSNPPVTLHHLWDAGLGYPSTNYRGIITQAMDLKKRFIPTDANLTYSPRLWSLSSFATSVYDVHKSGKFIGGTTEQKATPLPDAYLSVMELVAAQKATWAGYRVANVLQAL